MLFRHEVRRILAYRPTVDMRRSIDGLIAVVKQALSEDPLSGSLYVFVNRRGNYMKLAIGIGPGFACSQRSLSVADFSFQVTRHNKS